MAEKLTAEDAWEDLVLDASYLDNWRELTADGKSRVKWWFDWLRDRIATETAAEKDAEIARLTKDRDTWKANHDEMVARNKLLRDRPDITPEQYAQRAGWHNKLREKDAEIARLKAQLAEWRDKTKWVQDRREWGFAAAGMHYADIMRRKIETLEATAATPVACGPGRTNDEIWDGLDRMNHSLKWSVLYTASREDLDRFAEAVRADERARLAKPSPTPKPRRTGGQKVYEARWPRFDWKRSVDPEQWEAAAQTLGIPDDPQTPTDGELLEKAHDEAATNADWAAVAAEFLRLRAERDGGEA